MEAGALDRAATLALAAGAGRLLVKAGPDILRFDRRTSPITEADVARYLVHDDGFMRIPVLVVGDLLVRGFTDELYREALETAPR
jgi:hypothetical protein